MESYQKTKNKNLNIFLVIPAYNEESTIIQTIEEVKKIIYNIVVVDDGSTDKTSELVKITKSHLVSHEKNLGYARALSSGLKKAYSLGADYAITFDADGQHPAQILKEIKTLLQTSRPSLILGNRSSKNRMMEIIFGWYAKIFYGISDPLCGLKVISRKIFSSYGSVETHYTVGTEFIFKALNKQVDFQEILVPIKKRKNVARFGNSLKGNWLEAKALINIVLLQFGII